MADVDAANEARALWEARALAAEARAAAAEDAAAAERARAVEAEEALSKARGATLAAEEEMTRARSRALAADEEAARARAHYATTAPLVTATSLRLRSTPQAALPSSSLTASSTRPVRSTAVTPNARFVGHTAWRSQWVRSAHLVAASYRIISVARSRSCI